MLNAQTMNHNVISKPAVNQTTRTLSKRPATAAGFLGFLACLALLQAEVAVADEPNKRYHCEDDIEKQVKEQEIDSGPATCSAPYGLVQGTFLPRLIKELSLSEHTTQRQIYISGVTVEGEVRLSNMDIWSKIRFENCVFKDNVFFTNTTFRKGLSCHNCTFEGNASFDSMKVEGSADFEYTKFHDSVTFAEASVGDDLKMTGSRFDDKADFSRLHVGSDLCLDYANFFGDALFMHGVFGNFFSVKNACFGASEANFDNLKVGEDAIVKAYFDGPVRWDYGEAKGIYFKWSLFFDIVLF